jgi:CheY-like chemotaxis protein
VLTYLIEDSTPKAERITEFLERQFPALDVHTFGSYHSGLVAITELLPGIVLLDMTLPSFDRSVGSREGRLRPLGGYDLMRKLKLRNWMLPIIVVSQLEEFGDGQERVTFDEVMRQCAAEFPGLFIGGVYFGQGANSAWQPELERLIRSVQLPGDAC